MSALKVATGLRRPRGFTIVELLVAMTVGLIVLGALVTLLVQTNQANRINNGVARMQENARFALDLISRDIRSSATQYCSGYDNAYPTAGFNTVRAVRVHADGAMPHGLPTIATVLPPRPATAAPSDPYLLSPRYFIQGHECGNAACAPVENVLGADNTALPAIGNAAGNRPWRSDVLTVRYLGQEGLALALGNVAPNPFAVVGDPVTDLGYQAGDLLMLADCSKSDVFEAVVGGNVVTPSDGPDAGGTRNFIGSYSPGNDGRLFNFTRGFRTVTYFLRLKDDPDEAGRLMSVLVRQQNGVAEELIEGVERLDFRYVVEDAFNNSHLLTADQVQQGVSSTGAPLQCQPQPDGLQAQEPGCLWRSLRSVEVSMLVNTVENVLGSPSENYTYTVDGLINAAPTSPMPHGLPPERMMRREFVANVTVRNLAR